MAEDLVLSAITNLKSLYYEELNLFQFVNRERKKLQSNLSIIQSVLQDAEKKQLAKTSNALNDWLRKLNDAVYELDDILDDCTTEDIRDEYEGDRSCAFLGFLHPQKVMFHHYISSRMKTIREKLDFIAQEKDQFDFLPAERQPDANSSNIPAWRQTTSFITADEIFGRVHDKEIIVRGMLEGASHGDTLHVCPIVGIGGLGKTALAQLVYGDERVTEQFELKKWICVSNNFDLKILLKAITKSNRSPDELDELVEKLQGILQGKRYLIVLDDVWNDNLDKWIQLRSILACGAKGSAVLVTTRLEKVAMMMRTPSAQPYHLTALSEEDCWQLFRKRAFGSSIVQETQNLVSIGKDIARKCKGVPLAAKTLGGLLMFETEERVWTKIRDSKFWNLQEEEGSIFAALRLSYLNLPPRFRRCFSFCAIFPKDRRIFKESLIHLWIANGLISQEPSTSLELEDVGEMVVNELYWRSMIQDIYRDPDSGSIISFYMHDLVHDLAQSISCNESYAMEGPSSTDLSPTTRHTSMGYFGKGSRKVCNLLEKFESLRSLVFLSTTAPVALATSHSLKHIRLRALDWSGLSNVQKLPSSIGVLKHLRYLNLSCCNIKELPDSIGSLWNLQILNLNCCSHLKTFPVSIGRLKNLRHLCIVQCSSLSSMPQSMVGLTSLRTLSFVLVGEREKKEFQLSGLENMNYLRGQLDIKQLERVRDLKDAKKVNLTEKHDLNDLYLSWSDEVGDGGDDNDTDQQEQVQILEALRPPPRLRRLELFGYKGISFPHWMKNEIASFTNIQHLYLSSCKSCRRLPPLWRLPSLKKLELFDLPSMIYLIENEDSYVGEVCVFFPVLECLSIRELPRLKEIISGEKADIQEHKNRTCIFSPILSLLSIKNCPQLTSFISGPLPSLQSLEFYKSEMVMLSMLTSLSYNLQSLHSLEKLTMYGCQSFESFPDQMFQGMSSLRELYIGSCSKLSSLPESIQSLSSLEKLRIYSFPKSKDLSNVFSKLTSLQNLSLSGLLLKSLDTDTLADRLSLRCLELEYCPKLVSLPNWMICLVSLEELRIHECGMLRSIPESIQQLSKLERLYITGCPKLKKRCEEETGQDWHKIAHIPHIAIRNLW